MTFSICMGSNLPHQLGKVAEPSGYRSLSVAHKVEEAPFSVPHFPLKLPAVHGLNGERAE